jgi:uncharacterized protein (TIGR03032 family)
MTVNSTAPAISASTGLVEWLAACEASIALTTYQAGRLFLLGTRADGGMRIHERRVDHCQGLWTDGESMWLSSRAILWRFANDLAENETTERGAMRRFVPRAGHVTGGIDIHDIAVGDTGEGMAPIFVATAWNCLATISEQASFRPLWRPPFISALVAEDRCHLNGMAMDGTRPAYVTAVSRSDVSDGWRERRHDGGVVIDVASGEIVASGLSMPHSPRLYDGRLWLLNSGTGEFGWIDPASGRFEAIAFCPGYARGLAFCGQRAVIGLSKPRDLTFEGLALQGRLEAKDAEPRCGVIVVDLASGLTTDWLRFNDQVTELYDVATMPGVVQAEAVGFLGGAIREHVTVETR